MATTAVPRKAIVTCIGCDAILGAEIHDNGSFTPLGTEAECPCGSLTSCRLR
ncbi:hypothetical protein [Natronorubrum halalkaliphilum]|uniref:hypothetical protein n=1 Tax=Natronorubrum halalkaliphilum TaxID=2691917 RepID=UPI00191609A2|nr:hypothetical protein [Natronorubrum halalkaliphilum]